jgi:transcription elongation GreA/GreB family factor
MDARFRLADGVKLTAMSRAFVKDADENVDELPGRPISSHPNLVTVEGLAAIEATFTRLQQQHARALASGDRAGLAATARELRYWGSRRASAQVVATPVNPSKVQFGCSVTIMRDDARQQTYRIVGEDEADPSRGTISYVSPLARAVIGKQLGDTDRVGKSDLEVLGIT